MSESYVWTDPERMGGAPCFRGTRVPVKSLFDYLQGGQGLSEFLEDFPSVKREQAMEAIDAAGRRLVEAQAIPLLNKGEAKEVGDPDLVGR